MTVRLDNLLFDAGCVKIKLSGTLRSTAKPLSSQNSGWRFINPAAGRVPSAVFIKRYGNWFMFTHTTRSSVCVCEEDRQRRSVCECIVCVIIHMVCTHAVPCVLQYPIRHVDLITQEVGPVTFFHLFMMCCGHLYVQTNQEGETLVSRVCCMCIQSRNSSPCLCSAKCCKGSS